MTNQTDIGDGGAIVPPSCVALIVRTFDMGGAERCIANLANHLDRHKFRPVIICLGRSGTAAQWITQDDIQIIQLHIDKGNSITAWRRIARALKENRVTIAHSTNWCTLVETSVARRLAGTSYHLHVEQGTVLGALCPSWWTRLRRSALMGLTLRGANGCVAVAEETRRRICSYSGIVADRVQIIRNGVEVPKVADPAAARKAVRGKLGILQDDVVIGTVARLVPVKNLRLLVQAAHSLVAEERSVHVIVVGDGPERDEIDRLANDGPAARRIHLVGERQDVGRWLAAMDIYVNCSVSEGTSLSLMEAMGMGIPSIVTDVGDNSRLIGRGAAGLVVPSGDQQVLNEGMRRLARDTGLRLEMSARAKEIFADEHDYRMTVARYEELYDFLVSRRRRDRCGT